LHGAHCVSLVGVHCCVRYVPALQLLQAAQGAAPAIALYCPAAQGSHVVSAVALHWVLWKPPGGHVEQVAQAVALGRRANLPGSQLVHLTSAVALHAVATLLPAGQEVAQARQLAFRLAEGWYWLDWHCLQSVSVVALHAAYW
jgi:hypothetical protein